MLTGRRSLLLLALMSVLGLGAPAGADAACGVPSSKAVYETPEVQVYERAKSRRTRDLMACLRATGKARKVDVRSNDGMGTDDFSIVNGVIGGRWIWTSLLTSAAESADAREDRITDLRTGESFSILTQDEFTELTALAVPGALVVAGKDGVTAHFTDGRKETLSSAPSTGPAVSGARVYWREQGSARTATLSLPAADSPRPRPLARTVGRCRPRPGARLMLRADLVVVSRARGAVWICRPARGRTFRLGAATEVSVLSYSDVAYARPGLVGVVDSVRGRYRELEGTSRAVREAALLAAGPGGLRAWARTAPAPVVLSSEPATEVALGGDADGTLAYWLDAGGTARVMVVPS